MHSLNFFHFKMKLLGAILVSAALALTASAQSGSVVVWGDTTHDQTNFPPGLSNIVNLSAGEYHCLALRDDGKVFAWGDNSLQQVTLPPSLTTAMAIGAGASHSLAV